MTYLDSRSDQAPPVPTQWQSVTRFGSILIVSTFGIFGAWASVARLDSGAIAVGVVAVESNKKTIQHLEGGIVKEILVRDGDVVKENDILLKLDPTRVEAQGGLYRKQLAAALALESRLVAQRDHLEEIVFPDEVLALRDDALVARAMFDQTKQFQSRRSVYMNNVDVLNAQLSQVEKDVDQTRLDLQTAEATRANVSSELEGLLPLLEKQLVPLARVNALRREKLRLEGIINRAPAEIAKGQERITEAKIKLTQLRQDYHQEAASLLPDIRKTISDLRQQIIVAEDTLRRVEVRSPIAGQVQQLRIFTIGGVVRAGDPILEIVPASDTLVIRAKVSPIDADRVHATMRAEVKFPSFEKLRLPIVYGTIRTVSSDRILEPNTDPYFAAEIAVDRSTIPEQVANSLIAGMPADVIIPTGERTVMEYLITPLTSRLYKSMRER